MQLSIKKNKTFLLIIFQETQTRQYAAKQDNRMGIL